jgi:hypothetical protein
MDAGHRISGGGIDGCGELSVESYQRIGVSQMNSATYQSIFGRPKVRKTWKHTLSAEKNAARIQQMRFCKEVRKLLGDGYEVTFYFNPGGIAVWGETYVKISIREGTEYGAGLIAESDMPIVEACLSVEFSYIRQWDGRNSGRNYPCKYNTPSVFADGVRSLASRPFIRF